MDWAAGLSARYRALAAHGICAALVGIASIAAVPLEAAAEDTAIITRGDAAVTAFSGAKEFGPVPPDLHPLDRTFIDPNGAVLQVFDLSKLGGPPTGQVADAPVMFKATAGEIGQVFGVALDSDTANRTPNIYVTSTSLFGLQIVSAEGDRLVNGEPGARWMPGQFGLDKGGTPGSVWRIDGATGVVSLFANIKHDGKDNAGPGLGAIAYDPRTSQLFVSDLGTGLIHRLGADGSDRGTFDHGTAGRPKGGLDSVAYDDAKRMNIESPKFSVEDAASWGFTDKRRRVFAVAVQGERLYYSVAEGPQVWSVGITSDGSFVDDARLEIDVKDTPKGNQITGITFDGAGTLILAQRGEIVGSYDYSVFAKPQESAVLHYTWSETDKSWSKQADEFAIGLKSPHRSTEGGVALSYGYNPDGTINYDACRVTLWTTGEHLREGEDTERIYKGGALIVHGLQGNDKSKVRPDNVPPFETWFVDNDSLFTGADVYGHVGAIAIFNPCDKRAAAEPVPPPLPPPPPEPREPVGPGIYIDKECYPGPIGGNIHCRIRVINVGTTLSEPISITDAATILTGPGAGGAVTIDSITPDGPGWTCSPVPAANLWCSLPPGALAPGRTRFIDVWVDTGPLPVAGNTGFRNCASLGAPWFGTACDEGATALTVTKTAPAACAPGGACTFGVTITNTGSLPFSGDVLLTDGFFTGPGAPMAIAITAIVPPLGCAPAPAGLPFSCVAPLTLAPGESRTFAITMTVPVGPPGGYWARNCIAVSAPGSPAPALPPAPGTTGPTTACAWVPVGAPAPLSNLRVVKTALHGGKCHKVPLSTGITCDYEVSITNDGPAPYHGPVSFTDTYPAGALIYGPWWCTTLPVYHCTTPAASPADLAVGGSMTLPISLMMSTAALEAAGCTMPNTVTLTAPAAGSNGNYFGGDDTATATADAFLTWVDAFGVTHVACDPANLKITKVAKGDCVAADGGYRCEYKVTVTNLGPDPYHGPLKVSDQLGFAPTSATFSPPWGCTGGGASFQCTHPHVDLNKNDSVELTITAIVPEGPRCTLKDRALISFPPAGTRYNGNGSDDAASAAAKIPSKQCVKPERPKCEPGANEFRTESSACVCKSGYVRNEQGQCVKLIGPQLCPDGKPVPKSGRCPTAPSKCEPGPNEERNAQGQCVCKEGFERDKRGRCVAPPSPADECEERGGDWNEARKTCVMPPSPQEDCEKKGWNWDPDRERCSPPPGPEPEPCTGGKVRVGKRCVCPKGTVEKHGRCVQIEVTPSGPECIGGSIRKGKCVCPKGQEPKKFGTNAFQCVTVMVPVVPVIPAVPSVTCSGGDVSGGKCICPNGMRAKKVGANAFQCVTVMVPVVPVIPAVPSMTCSGGNVSGGKCVCPKGMQAKKVGANAFACEPMPGVGILPAPQSEPKFKIIPQMLLPICPQGTKWSEQYKKCLPILQ
ncbi:MAG: hypothetical protein K8F92_19005 [Hyphomicrobium sp.]|uniref:hypothetical protein n=1 Tax=Hyphomicrobium sp. TaxID=82 RepID=UPI001311A271|nr:hypothetical protein [Hyphomicrobium sp.]KAB2910850.1 MAG: hypothetical protein F9K29_23965 [Hyphomicrobiaceae bacterium]MBZ0211721.1 hypothetical protein [Hyphomicrobium sp.]